MSRAGVICEFNPFHNGHKYLLDNIKENYADDIVCIMSGCFVQRGDIAITDKYARTRAALDNGADMVVELPTVYAVSSARIFAENGVRLAAAANCDTLCFGAEDDIETLNKLADILESDEVNEKIREFMKDGEYYPRALSMAVGEGFADIINKPNNILALEYIKACKAYGITPVAIKRRGAAHDDDAVYGDIASAGRIRELILSGEDHTPYTPMKIDKPCSLDKLEPAILYLLKTISAEKLRTIAEIGEGLENRIIEAAKNYNSVSEILGAVKTKRYTLSRLRRIMVYVLMDITAEIQNTPVPYCRILGLKSGKESLIKNPGLPLIVKTKADYDKLDDSAKEIFGVDLRAAAAMDIAKGGVSSCEFSKKPIRIS